jgi:hypothetical protein
MKLKMTQDDPRWRQPSHENRRKQPIKGQQNGPLKMVNDPLMGPKQPTGGLRLASLGENLTGVGAR